MWSIIGEVNHAIVTQMFFICELLQSWNVYPVQTIFKRHGYIIYIIAGEKNKLLVMTLSKDFLYKESIKVILFHTKILNIIIS